MKIKLCENSVNGVVYAPTSKSYAQRALVLALLADGETILRGLQLCDDTRAAINVIEELGAKIGWLDKEVLAITGGLSNSCKSVNIGESGLLARLIAPICALTESEITIQGIGSVNSRPMEMVIKPLQQLGAEILTTDNRLPITIRGAISGGGFSGGDITVDGSISSQAISGLLISLPLTTLGGELRVNNATSKPYIDMTLELMAKFGVSVKHDDYQTFLLEGKGQYKGCEYDIEGDWSGAAAFLVAAAITGEVEVKNLNTPSLQADFAICKALELAGAKVLLADDGVKVTKGNLHPFEFDATQSPDLFPVLVALAAACDGTSRIKGANRLIFKESNRAIVLQKEYQKLGIEVDFEGEQNDIMTIKGGEIHTADVECHNDHRIAMSLTITALRCKKGDVTISGIECVAKSYPTFFEELNSLTYKN